MRRNSQIQPDAGQDSGQNPNDPVENLGKRGGVLPNRVPVYVYLIPIEDQHVISGSQRNRAVRPKNTADNERAKRRNA